MHLSKLVVLLLLATGPVQADLEIQSHTDYAHHAQALTRMQDAAARRSPSMASIPSLEQFVASIDRSRLHGIAQAPTFESPSRLAIQQLGCHPSTEVASGVERKDGGLNGVMSVYSCGARYIVTYEYTYAYPLTQRVVVIDEDFAKHTDPLDPLVKTKVITRGKRQMIIMRWLNPKNEIKYEVHADSSHSSDQTFENGLKSVLRATALELTEDTATNESR